MAVVIRLSNGGTIEVAEPDDATRGDRKWLVNKWNETLAKIRALPPEPGEGEEPSDAFIESNGDRARLNMDHQDALLTRAVLGGTKPDGSPLSLPVTVDDLDSVPLSDAAKIDKAVAVWAESINTSFSVDDAGDPDSPTPASSASGPASGAEAETSPKKTPTGSENTNTGSSSPV